MTNKWLRVVWSLPNVFCYFMFVSVFTFVYINADDLKELNRLSIWLIAMFILLGISIFGSFRI